MNKKRKTSLAANRQYKEVVNMLTANFDIKIATEVAREEGAMKKSINIAKKLIDIGTLSVQQIADATGLDQNDILKLKGVL